MTIAEATAPLQGRVARLITCSGGIGRAIGLALAGESAHVALAHRGCLHAAAYAHRVRVERV